MNWGQRFFLLNKILLFVVLMFLIMASSSKIIAAATIHGTVYNVLLEKETDTRIEIDTLPKQTIISTTGDYELEAGLGNYTISAISKTGYAKENITIIDDNEYTIDIVLEPTINIPIEFDEEILVSEVDNQNREQNYLVFYVVFGIILIVLLAVVIYYLLTKRYSRQIFSDAKSNVKKYDDETISNNNIFDSNPYEKKALDYIKKHTHTTQKDLRKELPFSEAKISLIVTSLEQSGKIKKIKKGRGNILVYIKD